MVQEKIAAFALVDDFQAENLTKMGSCLYQNNIIPIIISLKKGRNVVDKDKTIMTETDLTFARARTQIDALILSDDFSIEQLMDHGPFRKLVEKMVDENELVVAMGKAPVMLAEVGVAEGRQVTGNTEAKTKLKKAGAQFLEDNLVVDANLITAQSIAQADLVCNQIVNALRKAA